LSPLTQTLSSQSSLKMVRTAGSLSSRQSHRGQAPCLSLHAQKPHCERGNFTFSTMHCTQCIDCLNGNLKLGYVAVFHDKPKKMPLHHMWLNTEINLHGQEICMFRSSGHAQTKKIHFKCNCTELSQHQTLKQHCLPRLLGHHGHRLWHSHDCDQNSMESPSPEPPKVLSPQKLPFPQGCQQI